MRLRCRANDSRFLPYTIVGAPQYPLPFVRLYLALPWIWPILGRQFLVIARRPSWCLSIQPPSSVAALALLSIVIPARNEEDAIAATVEHLHLELRLHDVPHEIIVVDDGSTDGSWEILTDLAKRISNITPIRNEGAHGFGRAIICGLDHMRGDAVVIMMADESDDCRDVVRYWQLLTRGGIASLAAGSLGAEEPLIIRWISSS